MGPNWSEWFSQLVLDMSADGRRIGGDALVAGSVLLLLSDTAYVLTASWTDGLGRLCQVSVYYWRGPKQVEFLHGDESLLAELCERMDWSPP